ncbi:MAG: glycosyltransferase family 4 protein, partial [Gammaproteobacteria bacterium]|nr:glycosyltransferase family 4 protein [Gammaproteobacteria bacterium]
MLVVAGLFPPAVGARATQAGRLVDALKERGLDVRICCPDAKSAFPYGRRSRIASRVITKLQGLIAKLGVSISSPWIIKRVYSWRLEWMDSCWRPDIVLSLSTPVESHTLASIFAKKYRCKWAAFFSDPWPLGLAPPPYANSSIFDGFAKRGLSRSLKCVDLVVAPTRKVAEIIIDEYLNNQDTQLLEILQCAP